MPFLRRQTLSQEDEAAKAKAKKLKAEKRADKKLQQRIDHSKFVISKTKTQQEILKTTSSSAGVYTQNYKKNDGSISWWKLLCFWSWVVRKEIY